MLGKHISRKSGLQVEGILETPHPTGFAPRCWPRVMAEIITVDFPPASISAAIAWDLFKQGLSYESPEFLQLSKHAYYYRNPTHVSLFVAGGGL